MDNRYIGKIDLFYKDGKYVAEAFGAYGDQRKSTSKVSLSKAIENLVKQTGWIS